MRVWSAEYGTIRDDFGMAGYREGNKAGINVQLRGRDSPIGNGHP